MPAYLQTAIKNAKFLETYKIPRKTPRNTPRVVVQELDDKIPEVSVEPPTTSRNMEEDLLGPLRIPDVIIKTEVNRTIKQWRDY